MGILDFLFPKRCVSCGGFGSYLCGICKAKIRPVEGMICPMCERASFDGKVHPGCRTRYCLDGLISFFKFEGPIKDVTHRLKYKPWIQDLVPLLMSETVNILSKRKELAGYILVPVPLHPKRERERGFNQAELIGKLIAAQLSLEFKDRIIKRVRNTKPQVELKGKERRENLEGAFSLIFNSQSSILNSKILLVDDVWTTGSTLRACGNVLKREGVKKVWAMTLAR